MNQQTHRNKRLLHNTLRATLLLAVAIPSIRADKIELENGSVLIGKLISAESDLVVFKTPFAGNITVRQENIRHMSIEEPATVLMEDGTVYNDRQILSTDEGMLVKAADDGENVALQTEDIKMINPEPWKLGKGYKWSGSARIGIALERGNSDTDEYALSASSVWRSLTDRYTLEGDIENEREDGILAEDNWTVLAKYDRFFQGDVENYWGFKSLFESDEFLNLELRTSLGPYLGRVFFEKKHFTLQAELGPVYTREHLRQGDKDSWVGMSWIVKVKSDILGHGTEIYLNHDGNQILEASDDLILNTQIGLTFPLIHGFETAFEIEYEYDGGAVSGLEKLDTSYDWHIGYSW